MTSAITRGWRSLDSGQCNSRQKAMMMPACMMNKMIGFLRQISCFRCCRVDLRFYLGIVVRWIPAFEDATLRRCAHRTRGCTGSHRYRMIDDLRHGGRRRRHFRELVPQLVTRRDEQR